MDAVKIKWVNTNKVLRTPHRDLRNILAAIMMHRFRHAREVDLDKYCFHGERLLYLRLNASVLT